MDWWPTLLSALGWALWAGVVLVVFAQVLPDAKRRRLKGALDADEAAMRERTPAASDQPPGTSERQG